MEPSLGFCGPKAKRKAEDVEPTLDSDGFGLIKKGKGMFRCDLCNVGCNSKALLDDHLKGKKHKAKESAVKKFEDGEKFYCDICDVWCNSEIMLDGHLRGKKHKVNKATKEGTDDDPRGKEREKVVHWCEICEVGCNSEAVMANHLNGRKHKAKEARVKMHMEDEDEVSGEKEVSRSVPKGRMSNDENIAKENGNGKGLDCKEPKEFWCLYCRVKCESPAMIAKHLNGMEHEETKAMRWAKMTT